VKPERMSEPKTTASFGTFAYKLACGLAAVPTPVLQKKLWCENRPAPALLGFVFPHDKSPTSTISGEVPCASRRLNNRLGRRTLSCPTTYAWRFVIARPSRPLFPTHPRVADRQPLPRALAPPDQSSRPTPRSARPSAAAAAAGYWRTMPHSTTNPNVAAAPTPSAPIGNAPAIPPATSSNIRDARRIQSACAASNFRAPFPARIFRFS
jgi:hypothetical protein